MTSTKPLKERIRKEIIPALMKELGKKNPHAVPTFRAIHINVGIGKHVAQQGKDYDHFVANITKITGQKPVVTKSRKAISNFKLRKDLPSGVVVTLRKKRMYDFLDKLVHVVFPRIRDFRGFSSKSFDGQGNYSLGLREHTVFPEIRAEEAGTTHGLQITIETSAHTDTEGRALLHAIGFPFRKN